MIRLLKGKSQEIKDKVYTHPRNTPIVRFKVNKQGKAVFVKNYPSIVEAAKDVGLSHSTISGALAKVGNKAKGFYWIYDGGERKTKSNVPKELLDIVDFVIKNSDKFKLDETI